MSFDDILGKAPEQKSYEKMDEIKKKLTDFIDKYKDDHQLLADKLKGAIDILLEDYFEHELVIIDLCKRYKHVIGDDLYTDSIMEYLELD